MVFEFPEEFGVGKHHPAKPIPTIERMLDGDEIICVPCLRINYPITNGLQYMAYSGEWQTFNFLEVTKYAQETFQKLPHRWLTIINSDKASLHVMYMRGNDSIHFKTIHFKTIVATATGKLTSSSSVSANAIAYDENTGSMFYEL